MHNKKLKASIAVLESHVDHLESELTYIHSLLVEFGFPDGIESLKLSLEEMIPQFHS